MSNATAPPGAPATPRVRFAPSPTGMFHLGSARTALMNWMYARATGGAFLLRIEDTDTARSNSHWTTGILDALSSLGLAFDEEVYLASDHREDHLAAAHALHAAGLAYWCTCARSDVDARGVAVGRGYDGFCRDRGLTAAGAGGTPAMLRLRYDGDGISYRDHVLGRVTVTASEIGDVPLVKSSGDPLFLLGNVVDDAAQNVTLVMRGADHATNTPRYVAVWDALVEAGWITAPLPEFAHLPLIVGPSGKKLSKRRDKVAVESYLADGVLPGALLTYLAGLGWGVPEGRDRDPVSELAAAFRLSDVNVSNAQFDLAKLHALNADILRTLPLAEFLRQASTFTSCDLAALGALAAEIPSRVRLLSEVDDLVRPLCEHLDPDPVALEKHVRANPLGRTLLEGFLAEMSTRSWDLAGVEAGVRALAEAHELSAKKASFPLRVAVLASDRGLPLFDAVAFLGEIETTRRVEAVLATL